MMVNKLKEKYCNVFILGFSVGATIAWRCCKNSLCSRIIACYGSHIREYTYLNPASPTLLIFAKKDSFDVPSLVYQLQEKQYVSIIAYDSKYRFLDSFSEHFNFQQSKQVEESLLAL